MAVVHLIYWFLHACLLQLVLQDRVWNDVTLPNFFFPSVFSGSVLFAPHQKFFPQFFDRLISLDCFFLPKQSKMSDAQANEAEKNVSPPGFRCRGQSRSRMPPSLPLSFSRLLNSLRTCHTLLRPAWHPSQCNLTSF